MAEQFWACVKVERLHLEHLLQLLMPHTVLIETLCLKDLTCLFLKQHQLWNDAYMSIAMVTASAGTLL